MLQHRKSNSVLTPDLKTERLDLMMTSYLMAECSIEMETTAADGWTVAVGSRLQRSRQGVNIYHTNQSDANLCADRRKCTKELHLLSAMRWRNGTR